MLSVVDGVCAVVVVVVVVNEASVAAAELEPVPAVGATLSIHSRHMPN